MRCSRVAAPSARSSSNYDGEIQSAWQHSLRLAGQATHASREMSPTSAAVECGEGHFCTQVFKAGCNPAENSEANSRAGSDVLGEPTISESVNTTNFNTV